MNNVDYGNPLSWNAYAYANGDPVGSNDPNGLQTCGEIKITDGTFAGQTVSQVFTGTNGNDLPAQIIWHEGGTLYSSDLASTSAVNSYEQDLAAIGTAVLNQNDVDAGKTTVYQNGVAVCPLGQCLGRGLQQVIISIATSRDKYGSPVAVFDSTGHMIDAGAAKLSGILGTNVYAAPLIWDNGGPLNEGCEGVLASLRNASKLLDGTQQGVSPNGLTLLFWNQLAPDSTKFYSGYGGGRDDRANGETFWGLSTAPPVRKPPPPRRGRPL